MSVPEGWEAVIGLEIHVQLSTRSKMFCRCPNEPGGEPNTRICPVCTAQPGALPVANRAAVERTIAVGLALESEIAAHSTFHRKNYFYPDSPKAYQISQYDEPLCNGGRLAVPTAEGDDIVGFERVHLEEDAAKTIHEGGGGGRLAGSHGAVVDFNRCGTPLMEMVTQPDLRTPEQASRFAAFLRETIVALGVSECDMEKGSLRVDANVSLRRPGEDELRTKTELKNMNSFSYLERGIARELRRQAELYEAGEEVVTVTLHYDPRVGRAHGAALQGAGARLPLLPRARSGADRALGRADRASCARGCRSCRPRACGASSATTGSRSHRRSTSASPASSPATSSRSRPTAAMRARPPTGCSTSSRRTSTSRA